LPQTIELFSGTIAENIARFDPDATSEQIVAAAKTAGVHDMIVHLPEGYQLQVGESGAALSAGQRQRIALARALFGDPFLVVLDEPNSNLDAQGDAALTEAIRSVRARGGIAVVIAHRPSALAGVDKVLAMANGQAQAFGNKEDVLRKILAPVPAPASQPAPPSLTAGGQRN
jgi:ATP-binding cassette subfamily C protein